MNKITPFIFIIIFLSLSIPNIYCPGISIDEAEDGILSDYIFRDYYSGFENLLGDYTVIFNKIIPIANGTYTGAVNAYLMFVPSRLLGMSVFSVRLTSLLVSAITIFFIFHFCKIWFGRRVAFITALLTATNLFFVQYSRVGFYREEIFVIFFFWSGLFFLGKNEQKQNLLFLCLGLFFFGLGLSSKITFLFYIIGMVVAYALLRKRFNPLAGLNIKQIVIAFFSFCLGVFPLLFYNIKTGGATVKKIIDSLIYPTTTARINNLAYFDNLRVRIRDLMALLKEYIFERVDWGVGQIHFIERISPVVVGLVLISFVVTLLFIISSRSRPKALKYRILFLAILFVTVFLCTPFTVSGLQPGHLLVLIPFPQIGIALFLDYMSYYIKQRRVILTTIYIVFIIPILVFNIWMNIYFNLEMKKNGGYRRWSTTIYELAKYLKQERIFSPVTFGFGLRHNIAFLTNYQVIPVQLDENHSSESVIKEYKRLFAKNEAVFFLTKMSEDCMSNLNLFMRLANENNREKILYREFFNSTGEVVYWLYKIY